MERVRQIFCVVILSITTYCFSSDVFTETVNGIEWTYRIVNGGAVLGGNNNARTIDTATFGAISVPEVLGGYVVSGIGGCAFQDCTALTLITLPSNLRFISNDAFRNCSGLMTMNVPNGVTSIGARGFYDCGNMTRIMLPNSITNIEYEAFRNCGNLRNINLPTNLTVLTDRVFESCAYPKIDMPMGVTKIGFMAFSWGGCGSESIFIPDSVTEIAAQAFEYSGVRDVIIPGSVKVVGASMFYTGNVTNAVLKSGVPYISANMFSRTPLENIVIADTVSVIGSSAFSGCSKLKNPVLPSVLNTIGNNAFQGCTSITEITIPDNVQIVGGYAFKGCRNLKSIKFLGDAPIADTITFEDVNTDCTAYVSRKSIGWDVDIPGEWMGIKIDYFEPAIYTVSFDANGGALGASLCEASYGEGEALKNLPSPQKDGYTFTGWYSDSIDGSIMTDGVPVMSDMTLYAHWRENVAQLTVENGVLVHVDLNGEKSIEIPLSVTTIAADAFAGCKDMEYVSIPESVTSIPANTFSNCDKLWANWYKSLANGADVADSVTLMVTNVVVHYVTQSMPSDAVTPTEQTGLVNVIAEVSAGGPVAISSAWAEQYEGFAAKFGSDFTTALTKPTGKRDGAGNAMLVWQDYVAGTDPTKENDVFTASITFDGDGKPVISYTPELSAAETAKRKYRIYGKVKLNDSNWTEIPAGEAENYNFFKVTVEMK